MDISPDKQNIESVFSKAYYIDFYQREYKWTSEPVKRLLDDVFYKFNEVYKNHKDFEPDEQIIDSKYPWYYLNTYVTNIVNGKIYIVDGQQRLTTLTLILLNLYHRALALNSDLTDWLKEKICGQSGRKKTFWMRHEAHINTLESLFNNEVEKAVIDSGLTAENMVKNYKVINVWLDRNIKNKHHFETFVFYFLRRLVLINLSVEQTDVPMVFEVINDRGVRLKPYEILKGKLLGQIDKEKLDSENFNQLWEEKTRQINQIANDEMDRFFRFYLKARFSESRSDAKNYDGDYHRIMFSTDFEEKLNLNHNPQGVINFLKRDFSYYSDLYARLSNLLQNDKDGFFAFNRLNDIDGVLLLGMSICQINDNEEYEKIQSVAKEIDRLFAFLQLQNVYESNRFQEILYCISNKIRNSRSSEIRSVFDEEIKKIISDYRQSNIEDVFSYPLFKMSGSNLNLRFKRYFFARIEGFLAEKLNSNMRHSYNDLVTKTGSKNGFHIEHILSNNQENIGYFDSEDEFLVERNRLGGLLLLKGKDNISSNNEIYQEKLKTYSGTLLWNETLRGDFYKSNIDCGHLIKQYNLTELNAIEKFDKNALENRHLLLFKIAQLIWG